MRTDISTDLQNHLDTRCTTLAWCWRLAKAGDGDFVISYRDFPFTQDGYSYLHGETYTNVAPHQMLVQDSYKWRVMIRQLLGTVGLDLDDVIFSADGSIRHLDDTATETYFMVKDIQLTEDDIGRTFTYEDIQQSDRGDVISYNDIAAMYIYTADDIDAGNINASGLYYDLPVGTKIANRNVVITSDQPIARSMSGTIPDDGNEYLYLRIYIECEQEDANRNVKYYDPKVTRGGKPGDVLGFTNHDRDLTFDSVTYEASTGFLGTEIESNLGMAVDNMEVMGALDSVKLTATDIEAGFYDNAEIEVYLVNWEDVAERVLMKKGTIGEISRGEVIFKAEVRGMSTEMQLLKGRTLSYTCDAALGDDRCKFFEVANPNYRGEGVVLTTNGYSTLTASGLSSYTSGWFSRGTLQFMTGLNRHIRRPIKSHFNSDGTVSINLWEPLPFAIAADDEFVITAGCDKTWRTCKAKFGNGDNFRGFPHVPGTNKIIQYANQGDPNFDGGGYFNGKD